MVFVGMHPVLTQVPPKRCRSMMATPIPAPESRAARDGPACPVPITIASNWESMPTTLHVLYIGRDPRQSYRRTRPSRCRSRSVRAAGGGPTLTRAGQAQDGTDDGGSRPCDDLIEENRQKEKSSDHDPHAIRRQ